MATIETLIRLFTKAEFCFSCISNGDDKVLNSYTIKNETLRYILQESQLTLCTKCQVLATQTEKFLDNLVINRSYWQSNEILTETMLLLMKDQIRPIKKLSNSLIETQEYTELMEAPDWDESFHDSDVESLSHKVEEKCSKSSVKMVNIKIENLCENDNVETEYTQTSNEFDIKKHMAAYTTAMERSSKVKKEKPPVRRPRKGKYKIQSLRQSRDDVMRERRTMAADPKYLDSPFRCDKCVKGFTFRSAFENHLRKHEVSNGEYECDICQQRMDSEEKLQRHQKLHFERYRCGACGFTRACRSTIQEHLVAQHSDGQLLACPHCPKTFKRLVSRKKHILYHHRARPRASCGYCPKTYMNKELLKVHYATAHPSEVSEAPPRKPYECNQCDKAFTAPSLLKKHMLKHTDKKEFYCVECDKSFKSESILRTHLRVATPHVNYMELPFPCLHCEKRFSVRRDLEHHMNGIHLKIKPYQCDKCDRAYSSKCSLSKHIQFIHNGKRPLKHPCPVCEKLFDKRVLTNHLRTHTGERPYQCLQCPMKFSQSSILNTHVRLVHLKLRRDGTKREK